MDELDSLDKLGLEPANDESSTTANSIDINRESRAQMYLSDPKDLPAFTPVTTFDALAIIEENMIKTEEQKKNYEAIKAKDSTFKEIYSKKYLAIPIPEGNSNDIPQIDCLLAEGPEVDDRIRKLTTEKVLTDDEIIMFVNLRKEIPHNDMAKIEAIFLMLPDNKARMEYLRKISDKNKYITMTKAGNIANKYEFSENQEIKMRIAADILNKTFKIPPPNPDI